MSVKYDIQRIELPTIFEMKTVNAYLIKGEYNTLVDCGEKTDDCWQTLMNGLKINGLEIKDIDKILVTHAHVDHMGMSRKVAEESGAKVFVSDLVYDWAVHLEREWERRNVVMSDTFSHQLNKQQKEYFIPIFQSFFGQVTKHWDALDESQVQLFHHIDKVDISGTQFQSIHCPGHTFNQTCFFNELNGDFISADMLLRVTPTCVIEFDVEDVSKRNRSMPQLLESFSKLRKMEIDSIYPGHYEIMDNHVALIDRQVKRIMLRKNQVQGLIQNGTNRFLDIFNSLYSGKLNFPGLVMTMGYLDLLEDEGVVSGILTEDGIIYESL